MTDVQELIPELKREMSILFAYFPEFAAHYKSIRSHIENLEKQLATQKALRATDDEEIRDLTEQLAQSRKETEWWKKSCAFFIGNEMDDVRTHELMQELEAQLKKEMEE